MDSDPDVATGETVYTAGAEGENDHTIDAGLIAFREVDITKAIDAAGGPAADEAEFSISVGAWDFRGFDAVMPEADAAFTLPATDASFTLGVGDSHTITVPAGADLQVTEEESGVVDSYTVSPDGRFTVTGTAADPQVVTVTNRMAPPGTFTCAKEELAGEAATAVPAGTPFSCEYSLDGGETWETLETTAGGPSVTSPEIAAGTEVQVREGPLPDVENVVWGTPSLTVDGETSPSPAPIVIGSDTEIAVTMLNTANPPPPGNFSVAKTVTGPEAESVPDNTVFPVEYSLDGGETWVETTLNVPANGTAVTSPDLPANATVLVREVQPLPEIDGVVWGDITWTVGGEPATPDPETGAVEIVIGSAGTVALGVNNVADTPPPGDIEVTKTVQGAAEGDVPDDTEFTLEWTLTPDDETSWQSVTVTPGDTAPVAIEDIPAGSTVWLREGPLPDVEDVVWGEPLLSVGGEAATPGPVSVVVGSEQTVALELINTAELPPPGTFNLVKAVDGAAAERVPVDTEFTFEYSTDGGTNWVSVDVQAGEVWASGELPDDTVVWVREGDLPEVPLVEWGEPTWTVNGDAVEPNEAGVVVFRITSETSVSLGLTNLAEIPPPGEFSASKTVTGPESDVVPDDTEFQLIYSVDGGPETALTLTADGAAAVVDELPAGAEVTVREGTLPPVDGVVWGEPVLSVNGTPADSPATFTIGSGTTVEIGVENVADTPPPGGFQVGKAVTGSASEEVPPGTVFPVEYSLDGGETWTELAVPWGELEEVTDIPAGTVVQVREVEPLPVVEGVVWGEPTFTVNGEPIDGTTAEFTVASEATVSITITNTADTPPPGVFTATKTVSGDAAERVPEGTEFVLEWTLAPDDEASWQQLVMPYGGEPPSVEVPAGSVVSVREGPLPDVAGVVWGDATLIVNGEDLGSPAAFEVGSNAEIAVAVENTAQLPPPGNFSVRKDVTGTLAESVPPTTEFVLEYSADGGETWESLTVTPETPVLSPDFEPGTVIQVREGPLPEVPGVVWGNPVLGLNGVEVEGDVVEFEIGSEQTALISLLNTAEPPPPGSFEVTKTVAGPASDAVPPGTVFVLEYLLDAEENPGGDDPGEWQTLPVPLGETVEYHDIAAGSVVNVREGPEPEIPGIVWGAPQLTIDGVQQPGAEGSFVVASSTLVELGLADFAAPPPPPPPPTVPPTVPPTEPPTAPPTVPPTVPPDAAPDGPDLPLTGSDLLWLLVVALIVVVVGATLIAVRRRIRQ